MISKQTMKNVVLITDCTDVAAEQVKARLNKILSEKNIGLRIHFVFTPPFEIINGMFLANLLSEEISNGENTLYLAILNPLKKKPKRIFGQFKNNSWYVGADTGIFSLLFKDFGIKDVWKMKNIYHYPFGGLHVHAIVAARLLRGDKKKDIGIKIPIKDVKIIKPEKGEVIHLDNFGIIKIWDRAYKYNLKENSEINIKIINKNGKTKKVIKGIYTERMMSLSDRTITVYPGSSLLDNSKNKIEEEYRKSGLLELGIVRNTNSAKALGISIGDIIKISRIKK